ncbi:MAG: hypothetical protein GY835_25170, partial [bacterium]|nr:hypothetical protein [bacterium]
MNFRTPFAPVMMLLAIMTFGYSSNSYAVGTLPFAGVRADTIFGGTIDSDTQWSAGVYMVTGSINVSASATLTISSGAILKFNQSTNLDVRGGFVADDVVFTSWRDDAHGGDANDDGPSSGEPGDWQGIHFYDAAGGGAFTDCLVRYAGQHSHTPTGGNWGITARSCPGPIDLTNVTVEHTGSGDWAVYLATPGTISGCVFRDNLGSGLWIVSTDNTTISGNSATGNAGFGYGAHADFLSDFAQSSNTQSGNGGGDFVLASPTTVTDTTTWSGSYDYYFEADVDVIAGATLTISPGAILKFMPSTHLDVRGGFVADDVVFTSWRDDVQGGDTNCDGPSSGEPGDWQGIHFYDAAGGGSFIDCLVRYAGQHISTPTGGRWGITARNCPGPIDLTNVTVEHTGSGDWAVYMDTPGTISGCTVRDNLGNGLWIAPSDDTTISGNSATGNAGFGYGIHANLLGNFGQNSNTQSENGFGDFVL